MIDKEILDELEQIKIEIREIKSGLANAMAKLNSIQTDHNFTESSTIKQR